MSPQRTPARKDKQVNIRLTSAEKLALEAIGEFEDREVSYLVGWFVRWGIQHYKKLGSLMAMRSTKIVTGVQSVLDTEVQNNAASRLQLRKDVELDYDSGRSSTSLAGPQKTKKAR
jgi:uncharacterized protein YbcV (DUF1398 family)